MDSQKKTIVADERESDRIREWRERFARFQETIATRRLWFVDESGSTIAMTRDYARAPSGVRAVDHAPRNRGTVTTMIGALSLKGLGPVMTIEGATTGDVFVAYVDQLLAPALAPGDIVVMDNLSAHKDARVKQLIEAVGARLVFQPAYSPDLNPIELAWAKVKWFLKIAKARSHDALNNALAMAMQIIEVDGDAPAWFKHCGWTGAQQG